MAYHGLLEIPVYTVCGLPMIWNWAHHVRRDYLAITVSCERQQLRQNSQNSRCRPGGRPPCGSALGAGSRAGHVVTAVACASETTANLTQLRTRLQDAEEVLVAVAQPAEGGGAAQRVLRDGDALVRVQRLRLAVRERPRHVDVRHVVRKRGDELRHADEPENSATTGGGKQQRIRRQCGAEPSVRAGAAVWVRPCSHRPVTDSRTTLALGGKWSVTGFLMTLSSLCGPLAARIDSLCNSCTMRPAKRL